MSSRGRFRVYLGAAPGVGKTYAMLAEAHRRARRETDVDAALGNYFRIGNLAALRELALLWVADKVDDELDNYRAQHGISRQWDTRERVVVALTGGREGETLVRRGARVAAQAKGGELLAVHVARSDGLPDVDAGALQHQRQLVEDLGGSYHQVVGSRVADAVLDFARGVNASQLVLGASRRSWLGTLIGGRGVAAEVTRRSGPIDVHMVSHEAAGKGRGLPEFGQHLTLRRRLAGLALAVVGLPALTAVLAQFRGSISLASDLLLYQTVLVAVALLGGIYPAVTAAVAAGLLADWFFIPPLHTMFVRGGDNVIALVVFTSFALVVSGVVETAARYTREAARSRAEAQTLATLSGSLVAGQDTLPALLSRIRETFGLSSVALLERSRTGLTQNRDTWALAGISGSDPCVDPEKADTTVLIRPGLCLALRGRALPAADRSVLTAFAAQAATALEHRRLSAQAAESTSPAIDFTGLLTAAGTETVARTLGWAGDLLATHSDQRAELAADPARISNTPEETLRYEAPSPVQGCVTTREVDSAIPARSKIVLLTALVGHDERMYAGAARYDIHPRFERHPSFGRGIQFCLGASLARMEARSALEETLACFPAWDVDREDAMRLHTGAVRGYEKLPTLA